MNLNKAILIGRLTRDPELRKAGSTSVLNCSLATNLVYKNREGKTEEKTEFHDIVIWSRMAEIVAERCKKGSTLLVEGRIQTREWQDKQGNKRKSTEIVAENVQFGDKKTEELPY